MDGKEEDEEMIDGKNGAEAEAEAQDDKASCVCDGGGCSRFRCCCGY